MLYIILPTIKFKPQMTDHCKQLLNRSTGGDVMVMAGDGAR